MPRRNTHVFLWLISLLISGLWATTSEAQNLHLAKDNLNCLYGYKNKSGEWVIEPSYQWAESFNGRYAIVSNNDKYGVIDKNGNAVVPLEWDNVLQFYIEGSWQDLFAVHKAGKEGVADSTGALRLPPVYTDMSTPFRGTFIVHQDSLWGICNVSDWEVKMFDFKLESGFDKNGILQVKDRQSGSIGAINSQKQICIPVKYNWIDNYSWQSSCYANYYGARGDEGLDIYDSTGRLVASHLSGTKEAFSCYLILLKNGKAAVLSDSEIILPFKYENLHKLHYRSSNYSIAGPGEPAMLYKHKGKWGVLSYELKPQIKAQYDSIYPMLAITKFYPGTEKKDMLLFVKEGDKWGAISEKGSQLIQFRYDAIARSSDIEGKFLFIKDSLATTWNEETQKMEPVYGKARGSFIEFQPFWYNYIYPVYGKSGLMDDSGRILIPPRYNQFKVNASEGTIEALYYYDDKEDAFEIDMYDLNGNLLELNKHFSTSLSIGNGHFYVLTPTRKAGVIKLTEHGFHLTVDTLYHAIREYDPGEGGFWVRKFDNDPGYEGHEDEYMYDEWAMYQGNWGFIDTAGNAVTGFDNDWPVSRVGASPIAEIDGLYGVLKYPETWDGKYYDTTQWLIKPAYENITRYPEMYIIETQGKYGLADTLGNIIIPPELDAVFDNKYGGSPVYVLKNGQAGMIGPKGYLVSPDNPITRRELRAPEDIYTLYDENENEGGIPLSNIQDARVRSAIHNLFNNELLKEQLQNEKEAGDDEYPDLTVYSNRHWGAYPFVYVRYDVVESTFEIKSYSKESFSYIQDINDCNVGSRGPAYCQYYSQFYNYSLRGDSLYPLTLDSLLSPGYEQKLTAIITEQLKTLDNPDIDCSRPQEFISNYGENFILNITSLDFYIPYNSTSFHMQTEYEVLSIPYQELTSIARKESILKYYLER